MSTTLTLCSIAVSAGFGLWFGYYANREVRRDAAKKREAEARKAHEEAERGREINAFNVLQADILRVLTGLVTDPNRYRGLKGSSPALVEFVKTVHTSTEVQHRLRQLEDAQSAGGRQRREILSNQKDIQKALGMGQPVHEF